MEGLLEVEPVFQVLQLQGILQSFVINAILTPQRHICTNQSAEHCQNQCSLVLDHAGKGR